MAAAPSALPVKVYPGQDFYVPAFRIVIGPKELDPAVMNDVLSLTYADSLADIDHFEMTVTNWDAEKLTFKYSDTPIFNPWKHVEVSMGYYRNGQDERRRMLIGEITTLAPNFPASGGPTLSVTGLNLFHTFRTQQKTKPYFNKTETEIAQDLVRDIAADLRKKTPNLELKLDPHDVEQNKQTEVRKDYLLMNNQYPIVFLLERARDIGYELTLEPQASAKAGPAVVIFHYRPSAYVTRPTYLLEWGASLISFQPTLQTAQQVAAVTVRGWNPQAKKEFKATAKRADLAGMKVVNPADLALAEPAQVPKLEIVTDHPVHSQAEANELAKKILLQLAQGLVEARGKAVGLPDLRAGSKLKIEGLGSRFCGTYLVTSTTHSIGDGGYTTDFTARMEEPCPKQ